MTLTAPSIAGVFVRAVAALDDAVAHHGVEQALLPVLAHEIHVAGAQGLCRHGGQDRRTGVAPLLSSQAAVSPAGVRAGLSAAGAF